MNEMKRLSSNLKGGAIIGGMLLLIAYALVSFNYIIPAFMFVFISGTCWCCWYIRYEINHNYLNPKEAKKR